MVIKKKTSNLRTKLFSLASKRKKRDNFSIFNKNFNYLNCTVSRKR